MNIFVSISTKAYFVNVFNINCFWKVCEEVYVSEIVNLVTVAFHDRMQHQYWGLLLGFIFNCKFCEEFWAENNLGNTVKRKRKDRNTCTTSDLLSKMFSSEAPSCKLEVFVIIWKELIFWLILRSAWVTVTLTTQWQFVLMKMELL